MLRWKLRKWTGIVTVPVLVDGTARPLADSADIARWADQRGDGAALEKKFTGVLDELRVALARAPAKGEPKTLLGTFTFADIAMAQVLACVSPPTRGLRLGRASRRAFTDLALRERYADLVAWRDAIYAAYRT
jgi:glutathione S-transferase